MMKSVTNREQESARVGEALARAIQRNIPISITYAEVETVDEDTKIMDVVVDNETVLRDVSLDIFPDGGNGILFIPAIGSMVVIGFMEDLPELPVLLQVTSIDRMIVTINDTEDLQIDLKSDYLEIKKGKSSLKIEEDTVTLVTENVKSDADQTTFNGGNNGGMVLINELTGKLNQLVATITANNATFIGHTHPFVGTAPGVAGVTAVPTTPMQNPAQFVASDYENTDITQ